MIAAGEYSKTKVKSGKWTAKISHPISKVWVLVGIYTTPEEAEDACAIKNLEYQSCSSQGTDASYNTDVSVYENHTGIKRVKSGRWSAQIQHNNVGVWLGTYNSPKEAANSYILSRLELDSQKKGCSNKVDELISQKAHCTQSGTRYNPCNGKDVTARDGQVAYDTAEETYSSKKRKQSNDSCCQGDATVCELDEPTVDGSSDNMSKLEINSQNIDCGQSGRTRRVNGSGSINKTKSGKWRAVFRKRKAKHYVGTYATLEDAEAAITLKKRELVLKAEKAKEAYRNKKQKQRNDSCEEYAVMDGKSDSTCESDDPFVCIDGSSVFKADREEEEAVRESMNAESIGEFDIVNEYGQLVGEYSRMDDDLWLSW